MFKIGSATALIGDPSGKTSERKPLETKETVENSKQIENNIRQIFENHENYIWKKENFRKDLKLPELQ